MTASSFAQGEHVAEAAQVVRGGVPLRPRTALVLGSGLGGFTNKLTEAVRFEAHEIPHYPRPSVEGHRGGLVVGLIAKSPILVLQGRVHYYESGSIDSVLFPIALARELGVETLILTNAAGAVQPSLKPGNLMLITDHVNLTFSVLPAGTSGGTRRKPVYDSRLIGIIRACARSRRIPLRSGVYCSVSGPSYETAAEIRMIRKAGADAVGMSTANEAAFAANCGMSVAGISCITNLSTGLGGNKLAHAEVTAVADRVARTFSRLIESVVTRLDERS